MKKVFVGLSVGFLIVIMGAGTAYSHDKDSRDATSYNNYRKSHGEKVVVKTSPRISIRLPSLDIKVGFVKNRGVIWIPGYWQHVGQRRGYVWIPGHWEKKVRYYSRNKDYRYCER